MKHAKESFTVGLTPDASLLEIRNVICERLFIRNLLQICIWNVRYEIVLNVCFGCSHSVWRSRIQQFKQTRRTLGDLFLEFSGRISVLVRKSADDHHLSLAC